MSRVTRVENVEEMHAFAADFAARMRAAKSAANAPYATLIGLSGELGAGKTTFMQGVAAALGIRDAVTSPTFVLVKIYALPEGERFKHLVHMDAYRLDGAEDLAPLGWSEFSADPDAIVFVEWAERIEAALPQDATRLIFSIEEGTARTVEES